jgi:acetylornithine/succinyldiaminopimelate/putrescine aminotransferase
MTGEIAQHLAPGMHGCTFGGSPAAATAGLWALEQVKRPGFLSRVRRRARRLEAGLEALQTQHASIGEARGLGLLRAVEVAESAGFGPAELVAAAREQGLLLVRGGERAVRLLPPLNVTEAEIDEALELLDRALRALESKAAPGGAS